MVSGKERERERERLSGNGDYVRHLNLFQEKVPDMIFVLFVVLPCPVSRFLDSFYSHITGVSLSLISYCAQRNFACIHNFTCDV
jgi:hypothetical protein